MTGFWGTFLLMLAAGFASAVTAGFIVAGVLESRLAARLDQVIDANYRQVVALREKLDDVPDDIVERVDSASLEQHDQTRRILEQPNQYTGSYEMPLPTVDDVQRFAGARNGDDDPRTAAWQPPGYPPPPSRPAQPAPGYRPMPYPDPVEQFRAAQARAAAPPAPDPVDRRPERRPRHGYESPPNPNGV